MLERSLNWKRSSVRRKKLEGKCKSDHTATAAASVISLAWETKWKNILPYSDVILDIWVDNLDKSPQPHDVHLIECNSGGIWGSSGSFANAIF